jgi:hypothetical protein
VEHSRAISTLVFWSRFRARNGVDLQMDALLCAKLHRAINVAQSRKKRECRRPLNVEICYCVNYPRFFRIPSSRGHGVTAVRRLWQYLIRQAPVQKVFIKYIFSHRPKHPGRAGGGGLTIPESQSYVSRLSLEAAAAAAAAHGGDGGCLTSSGDSVHIQLARMHQPVKIIHKDHDAVTAFCINKVISHVLLFPLHPFIYIHPYILSLLGLRTLM